MQTDLEERAVAAAAACTGRSIKIAVAAQDQIRRGICAVAGAREGVQNGLGPARGELEDQAESAGAALQGTSIEIAVATLDHTGFGIGAVAAAAGKGVQNRLDPARRELEDRAVAARAALIGRSIEIAVAALDHAGIGMFAVVAPGEGIQNRLGPARCDLEDRAKAVGAAEIGCSVEVAVAALDQTGIGSLSVGAGLGEGMQHGLGPAGRDLEHRTAAARAAAGGGSVDIAIAALNQTGIGDAGEGIKNALGPARRDLEDRAV